MKKNGAMEIAKQLVNIVLMDITIVLRGLISTIQPVKVSWLVSSVIERTKNRMNVIRRFSIRLLTKLITLKHARVIRLVTDTISIALMLTYPPAITGKLKGTQIGIWIRIVTNVQRDILVSSKCQQIRCVTKHSKFKGRPCISENTTFPVVFERTLMTML